MAVFMICTEGYWAMMLRNMVSHAHKCLDIFFFIISFRFEQVTMHHLGLGF